MAGDEDNPTQDLDDRVLRLRINMKVSAPEYEESELLLDLVIDSAGKVRSAEPAGKTKWADADLLRATEEWKFIPAFKGNRPVACRSRLAVSLTR